MAVSELCFQIFCWTAGAIYAALTIWLTVICIFATLWHGRAVVLNPEIRYFLVSLGSLAITTSIMAATCLKARNEELGRTKWIGLSLAALLFSSAAVLSMAGSGWSGNAVPNAAYQAAAVIVSVWIVLALLAWRRHIVENQNRRAEQNC